MSSNDNKVSVELQEVWKDVVGYEGYYQVSNLGRVKSLDREISYIDPRWGAHVTKKISEKILRPRGYKRYLCISLSKNNIFHGREIHRLVLETFVGPCPEGMVCCHRDGNRHNNNLDNLRWDTAKGNAEDNIKNGTRLYGEKNPLWGAIGEKNPNSKLKDSDAETIRELRASGLTYRKIGEMYGVALQTIHRIVIRRRKVDKILGGT